MVQKCCCRVPAGIPLIAIPWFLTSGLFALGGIACIGESTRSVTPATGFRALELPWESSVFLAFMNYTPILVYLAIAAGAFWIAGGLLRCESSAARMARYFAAAWVLFWLAPLIMTVADPSTQLDFLTAVFFLSGAAYNVWSWWYLSRATVQEKMRQELIILNLGSV